MSYVTSVGKSIELQWTLDLPLKTKMWNSDELSNKDAANDLSQMVRLKPSATAHGCGYKALRWGSIFTTSSWDCDRGKSSLPLILLQDVLNDNRQWQLTSTTRNLSEMIPKYYHFSVNCYPCLLPQVLMRIFPICYYRRTDEYITWIAS